MTSTSHLYGPPKVGGDILSYCSKCKMDLAHVIVSMLNGRPAKVICKTCRGQHNYKRSAGDLTGLLRTASKPTAARKPSERSFMRVSEMWEKKMAEKKATPMRTYNVQQSFAVGDVIQHPNFGVGLVEEVKRNGKITVLFREDEKVLVHGLGAKS